MKIVFFSNYLNHHQIPLADAFSKMKDIEYYFVADHSVPEFRKKLGYISYHRPYLIELDKAPVNHSIALKLAVDADVAILVNSSMEVYLEPRLRTGKLTFLYSERWFKKRYKQNLLSPRLLKQIWTYIKCYKYPHPYMLCSSAYAANDYYFLHMYKNRCFKWAYFTKVEDLNINEILSKKRGHKPRIMWCSRFIDWKHPELMISLAQQLISDGYNFDINMFGNGPLLGEYSQKIDALNLSKYIHLKGNASNEEILKQIQSHHMLIFTSDQNEGWGAVANETMSNGCTLVGSNEIGAIPFLVKDGVNGLIFESRNFKSLYNKVKNLMDNPDYCEQLAFQAYDDMCNIWSPEIASHRFIELAFALQSGKETPFVTGPCSTATPLKN